MSSSFRQHARPFLSATRFVLCTNAIAQTLASQPPLLLPDRHACSASICPAVAVPFARRSRQRRAYRIDCRPIPSIGRGVRLLSLPERPFPENEC